jgi:curved DNA-binding protein CbpA
MPDPIPTDDLYARLGVAIDADTAAVDRAWRSLLKRHHPDVAGSRSLELAKLINVAHDWLSQPARRARYDAARVRGMRSLAGRPAGAASGRATPPPPRARRRTWPGDGPGAQAPTDDLDETFGASGAAVRSFLAQAARLTQDDLDRLSVSEPERVDRTLRRMLPPDLWARVVALDARLTSALDPRAREDPVARESARSYGQAVVLDAFLWFYLADPEEVLERMRRGWESAVGLPRYGPNTDEVRALIERFRSASEADGEALADAWTQLGGDGQPWPPDAREFDFAAFEVSTALARRDAAAAPALAVHDPAEATRLRDAFASTAHIVTLRPIFPPRGYARYQRSFDALGGPAARPTVAGQTAGPTVRRTRS